MISAIKGLFVNNRRAQDSIYESGLMVYNCLKLSGKYSLDYIEIDYENKFIPLGYHFYFFNYHPSTMGWMDTSQLKKLKSIVITMILEVLPGDPFVMCPDNHFNGYCVIDPTLKIKKKKIFVFPRPLDSLNFDIQPYQQKEIPVIGSFGFATKGKGFQHVVEAVNKEFDEAVVKINIPFGDFVPDSKKYASYLEDICTERAKEGVRVIITHDYMSKEKLIEWCSQNTLNCFLYDRNLPGLAATTDQAIVSGRPLIVSKNDTFRHILAYIPSYPAISLKESIDKSIPWVKQMQQDWSSKTFVVLFENMIEKLFLRHSISENNNGTFEIPILKNNFINKIDKRYRKYKRFLNLTKLKYVLFNGRKLKDEELI
ncbi:MAG TPA: hypothetical protein VIJ92_00950 [Ginsengibacter sp.]